MTLRDLVAPKITEGLSGGMLDAGGPVGGTRAVRLTAEDAGGGLLRAVLLADGQPVAEGAPDNIEASCAQPYTDVTPCPARGSFTIEADTRRLTNGPHRLEVRVIDVAGNETVSDPVTVSVRNDGAPNGVGATRFASLTGRFDRATSAAPLRRKVAYGRRAVLRGRLTDAGGRPIGNAQVDVAFRVDRPGSGWNAGSGVSTDASGKWTVWVPAGASREVKVAYKAYALDDAPSTEIIGRLTTRAGVRLSVKPGHVGTRGSIRFDGRLLGGPGRKGVQVALYAVPRRGSARVPVAVLRSDLHGHFTYRYRFTRTLAPTTYWFQATLENQRGYPYAPARSRRVSVRVG